MGKIQVTAMHPLVPFCPDKGGSAALEKIYITCMYAKEMMGRLHYTVVHLYIQNLYNHMIESADPA